MIVDDSMVARAVLSRMIEAQSDPLPVRAAMAAGWERVSLGMVETETGPLLLVDVSGLVAGVEIRAAA